jgi:hypothetical protein
MRSRNLKPGFFKNPELADAGPHVQLLFAGLWCLADREGRLKDSPRVIKAEIFPFYEMDVNGGLTVLERLGNVLRYDGIIQVINFAKHQSPHKTEKASQLPACDPPTPCKAKQNGTNAELTLDIPLSNGGNPSDSLIPSSLIHSDKNGAAGPRSQKPRKASKAAAPPELHQQIKDAYHRLCPALPQIKSWPAHRRATLNSRIKERCAEGKPADAIGYWESFFESVAASDFLCGRTERPFFATIDWLLGPKNFHKVIENNYRNRSSGPRAHG